MIKVTVKFVTEKKVTTLPLQLRKKNNIIQSVTKKNNGNGVTSNAFLLNPAYMSLICLCANWTFWYLSRLSKTTKAFGRGTQASFRHGGTRHDVSSSLGKVQDTDQHNPLLHGQKGHSTKAKTRSRLQQSWYE